QVGADYWQDLIKKMLLQFRQQNLSEGISLAIADLGKALQFYFPFHKETDKNELPDEIIFGR
ncbi:MAG: TPM domain-containing protein, partial [Flavisolibacter sp.]